jgi:hypothetical protein
MSTIDRPARRLLVHAVLDADASAQLVRVENIDGTLTHDPFHVPNAAVTITAPDGTIYEAEELPQESPAFTDGVRGYRAAIARLIPGGTYTLRVQTPDNEVVTGTTTVPQFQTLDHGVRQQGTFDRRRDTLRLDWPRMPLAARYQLTIQAFWQDGDLISRSNWQTFADTSVMVAGTARTLDNDEIFIAGTAWRSRVMVVAVDDNYYAYYHTSSDPFAGAPPSRLTGALGVFGSIVPVIKHEYSPVVDSRFSPLR